MNLKINTKEELDKIFEEYQTGINRGKYKRFAKAIAVLMEYNEPGSYKRFLGKNQLKSNREAGSEVGSQFNKKILSVHLTIDRKNVMDHFHSIILDYNPKDIVSIAETYKVIAKRDVEKISTYEGIIASEALRSGLYNALKAAKIDNLIDVLGFSSEMIVDVPRIRNLGPKKYDLLMSLVNLFSPKNNYFISTGEIEIFKRILSEGGNDK